jgi:hypothetical protein
VNGEQVTTTASLFAVSPPALSPAQGGIEGIPRFIEKAPELPGLFLLCGRTTRKRSSSRTCPAGVRLEAILRHILVDVASLVLLPAAAPTVFVPRQMIYRALNSVAKKFFNR